MGGIAWRPQGGAEGTIGGVVGKGDADSGVGAGVGEGGVDVEVYCGGVKHGGGLLIRDCCELILSTRNC